MSKMVKECIKNKFVNNCNNNTYSIAPCKTTIICCKKTLMFCKTTIICCKKTLIFCKTTITLTLGFRASGGLLVAR